MNRTRRIVLRGLATAPVALAIPSAVLPAAAVDPIFAAIENHKAAWAAFEAEAAISGKFLRVPEHLREATEAAGDHEQEVRYDMHETTPTTIAGLAAYVAYWHDFVKVPEGKTFGQLEEIGWEALPTIAEAMANLFPQA